MQSRTSRAPSKPSSFVAGIRTLLKRPKLSRKCNSVKEYVTGELRENITSDIASMDLKGITQNAQQLDENISSKISVKEPTSLKPKWIAKGAHKSSTSIKGNTTDQKQTALQR